MSLTCRHTLNTSGGLFKCEFEQEAKAGHLRFIDWLDFEEEF